MAYALLFPGQGAQEVGMAAAFQGLSPDAAAVLDMADRVTGLALISVMAEGPIERLTETSYAQTAVVATSLAALAAFREQALAAGLSGPTCAAGHSVGELTALTAVESLDPAEVLRLVAERARLMAAACRAVDGGMAAVLGLGEPQLVALCEDATRETGETVAVANLNAPDQLVVSGHRVALTWLATTAPQRGARRVIPLKVGGPFHSPYMRQAAEQFAACVAETPLLPPRTPIISNRTASPLCDVAEIRRELGQQIAEPVRWSDSLRAMAGLGCTLFIELGPGQVLSGLVRRTLPDAKVISVNGERGLEAAVAAVAERGRAA